MKIGFLTCCEDQLMLMILFDCVNVSLAAPDQLTETVRGKEPASLLSNRYQYVTHLTTNVYSDFLMFQMAGQLPLFTHTSYTIYQLSFICNYIIGFLFLTVL